MFKNSVKQDGYLSRKIVGGCGRWGISGTQARNDLVPFPKQAKQQLIKPLLPSTPNNLRASKRNDDDGREQAGGREEPKSVKKRTAKKNNCLDSSGDGGSGKVNKRAKRARDVFDDDCEQEADVGESPMNEDISG